VLVEPWVLWPNTAVLVVSSIALYRAQRAVRRGDLAGVRSGLLVGGVTAVGFLAGQLVAWRQLVESGHLLANDPAAAFFYIITGAHGLHIVGGLIALARAVARASATHEVASLRLSVELCAIYWHVLLLVWLALFNFLLLT
jgi:cytochrome c oxidase subunit 3